MNEVFPRFGAQIAPRRPSLRELSVAAVCVSLLLSLVVPACWVAGQQWEVRYGQRILDRMGWHEPLDSWSQ
jgi:hypothetical protein